MRIIVGYHSAGGLTELLAREIAIGAASVEAVDAKYLPISELDPDRVADVSALIIGSPSYFGNPVPEVGEFWKRISHLRSSMQGKVGAAFSTGLHQSGGRETTIMSIIQSMLIFGMIVAGDPLETGGHYGLTVFGDATEKSLEDARRFGRRIAEIIVRLES